MYIAQSKNKKGILIVDKDIRYFVSWYDLDNLKAGKFLTNMKPIIILKPLEQIEKEKEVI